MGDTVNVLPAAAAYNFRRAMKAFGCMLQKICGSSDISSDGIKKKKTAEQFVYLNNHKQMYKDEQQFSISCFWAL